MTKEVNAEQEMRDNVDALHKAEAIVDDTSYEEDDIGEGEQEDIVEYTATELKAIEKGWNPDKDNLPEGKEWISAGEFLRNEKFFAEIHKLKQAVNSSKKDFETLKEHHRKVQEVEREKLLSTLKHQKRVALEEDDHAAVVEIDEQILELKNAKPEVEEQKETEVDTSEIFQEWVSRNSWYKNDEEMRDMADELGAGFFQRNGGKVAPEVLYDHVEKRMKQIYPDRVGVKPQPKKKAAVAVEPASRGSRTTTTTAKTSFSTKDLNDMQRRTMRTLVKAGALTEKQYIDELVRIGELG